MKDILEDLGDLFEEFDMSDELVEQNHLIVDKLNKRYHHKIKKPFEFGVKAS